ncbi:ribonuclease Z [Nematocida minor]|uniref:ribonuclease Z n=1 Tax=Nematocida minor TaxID=1912983 RepID=UPI00221EC189|nr:ribonuclease Z [Nematocida minor]KAI5191305.1 ribonuclease Z [Nematocida minor]
MYRAEIHTTESGSAVRIVNTKTAEYVLVGGFEGIQRYAARNKIKWSKMAVICLCSRFEAVPAISAVLTHGIQNSQRTTTYVCSENTLNTVGKIGISIGNLEFFDRYSPSSKQFPRISIQEIENISYLMVPLPEKAGGFDIKKANDHNIVEKRDIIQLNKTGQVTVGNITHFLEHFKKPTIHYPSILVLTLLSPDYVIDIPTITNALASSGLEIFVRAGPGVFKNKKEEHKALGLTTKLVQEIVSIHKKSSVNTGESAQMQCEVYTMFSTERETESVKTFYDKMCSVYKPIVRPLIYQPKYTKYFRNSRVLTDGSAVEYTENRKEIACEWLRSKKEPQRSLSMSKSDAFQSDNINARSVSANESISTDKPYTVFLGTAAAVPGVFRNVSSVLMTSSRGSVLLDCGEDTHTQLNKISKSYSYNYRSLSMILLTHRHADHILGAFSVLKKCCMMGNRTALVFGNRCMVSALEHFGISCIFIQNSRDLVVKRYRSNGKEYIKVEENKEEITICITENMYSNSKLKIDPLNYVSSDSTKKSVVKVSVSSLNTSVVEFVNLKAVCAPDLSMPAAHSIIYEVSMCTALHIHESYSVKVQEYLSSNDPYTVVYSGDTLPNKLFAQLGHQADLMIHEGTFEHEDLSYARATNHSTIHEALQIFKESLASTLFITHFSQRYKTVTIPPEAYLAMDYMVHSSNDLHSQLDLHRALQEWANANNEPSLED